MLVRSTLRPIAAELGFAHPMGKAVVDQVTGNSMQRIVAELGFVGSTLGPVVVELAFVPNQVFVVAEHPKYWVVDQVGSKNLHPVYFPVGSIPVLEPVVPDVANLKMQQH